MADTASSGDIRTGGCRCGAVRYRVAGKPIWVAHCHCNDCRRSTGAPFVTWCGFAPSAFRWEGLAPQDYASSPGAARSFCPRCGTPLAFTGARWPNEIHLLVGTFDDPASLEPRGHVYVQEQIPWIKLNDGLKRFAKTGKEGPPLP